MTEDSKLIVNKSEDMINLIVFTKDRSMQLQLLLQSIKLNANNVFKVNIIYKSSNDDFDKGYEKLKSENIIPDITWVKETDFKNNVLQLLQTNAELSCFATDDDIVYRPINEQDIITTMKEHQDVMTFNLRLGININWCYTLKCDNILGDYEDFGEVIKWDWTNRYADMGYPLNVDLSIFRTKEILRMTKQVQFHNPNTFEGGLQMFEDLPRPKMASYKHSVVVNSPTNIVNTTHPNRKGEQFGISAEELNKKYLDGEVIDFDAIDFSNINSPHVEIDFKFKKI